VTYFFRLKRLERTLKYSKITRKSNGGIDVNRWNTKLALGIVHEYELDLTYIDIELLLREFFKTFSRHMDFYVIFDELDKFEAKAETETKTKDETKSTQTSTELKKPHELVRELKNLFTTSNAKFIFTSTGEYYQEISEVEQDPQLGPLNYKYSIFSHKILIGHFEPNAFNSYLDYLLKPYEELTAIQQEPYEILKYKLMWITDLYPLATKKKLFEVSQSRDDGTMYVDLVNIETSLLIQGENVDSLMYVLIQTYNDFTSDNDAYYNRTLYKSLKHVANLVLSRKKITFRKANAFSLILHDVTFSDDNQRKKFFLSDYPQYLSPNINETTDAWIQQLMRRDSVFKQSINKAVITFVAYLDIADLIDVTQSTSDVASVTFIQSTGSTNFIDTETLMTFPLDEIKKREKRQDQLVRSIMRRANNTNIKIKLPENLAVKHDLRVKDMLSLGWNLFSILTTEQDILTEQEAILENKIASKIMSSIEDKFIDFVDPSKRRNEYIFTKDGNRYQILMNPHQEGIKYASRRKDITHVICINPKVHERLRKTKKVSYFKFKANMSDYDEVMRSINNYLEKNLNLVPSKSLD